jgi:hypothetical protein
MSVDRGSGYAMEVLLKHVRKNDLLTLQVSRNKMVLIVHAMAVFDHF